MVEEFFGIFLMWIVATDKIIHGIIYFQLEVNGFKEFRRNLFNYIYFDKY